MTFPRLFFVVLFNFSFRSQTHACVTFFYPTTFTKILGEIILAETVVWSLSLSPHCLFHIDVSSKYAFIRIFSDLFLMSFVPLFGKLKIKNSLTVDRCRYVTTFLPIVIIFHTDNKCCVYFKKEFFYSFLFIYFFVSSKNETKNKIWGTLRVAQNLVNWFV